MNLEKWQSKNKCFIVSKKLQEQQLVFPCQFLFTRLSLVNVTPFCRHHNKKKNYFQRHLDFPKWAFMRHYSILYHFSKYIERTVKESLLYKSQRKVSLASLRFTNATVVTNLYQFLRLSSTRALLKETLSGLVLRTCATVCFFFPNQVI